MREWVWTVHRGTSGSILEWIRAFCVQTRQFGLSLEWNLSKEGVVEMQWKHEMRGGQSEIRAAQFEILRF